MILWLLFIILAYFFFSLSSLGDKLILSGTPKPRTYTFYVGVLGLSVFLFLPFVEFRLPNTQTMLWIVAEAFVYIASVYVLFTAVKKFEISRVAVTIGAAQPVFVFIIVWLLWGGQAFSKTSILAFLLLLIGSIIISIEKKFKPQSGYFKLTLLAGLLFSVDYVITKIIFNAEPFLLSLFWMRVIAFFLVLLLLFSKNARKDIFAKKGFLNKKTASLLVATQTFGGLGLFFQSFAISLAPIAMLPILNSLRGVQYVFLFAMILILSLFLPKILKEKISKKIILQKTAAIIIIAAGLALLVF